MFLIFSTMLGSANTCCGINIDSMCVPPMRRRVLRRPRDRAKACRLRVCRWWFIVYREIIINFCSLCNCYCNNIIFTSFGYAIPERTSTIVFLWLMLFWWKQNNYTIIVIPYHVTWHSEGVLGGSQGPVVCREVFFLDYFIFAFVFAIACLYFGYVALYGFPFIECLYMFLVFPREKQNFLTYP